MQARNRIGVYRNLRGLLIVMSWEWFMIFINRPIRAISRNFMYQGIVSHNSFLRLARVYRSTVNEDRVSWLK
jgi:hypothetical protein